MGRRLISARSSPSNRTDRASRRSLLPWQSGQARPIMKRAARFFIIALWVVAKLCVTWRWALEKVPI